jgi:hypothetical protein
MVRDNSSGGISAGGEPRERKRLSSRKNTMNSTTSGGVGALQQLYDDSDSETGFAVPGTATVPAVVVPSSNSLSSSSSVPPLSGNALRNTTSNSSSIGSIGSKDNKYNHHHHHHATIVAYFKSFLHTNHSIKIMVLIVLSLQNSLFTVLRRYSQGIKKEMYSKYEVLMMGEIIKLIFSAYMIHRNMVESTGGMSALPDDKVATVPLLGTSNNTTIDTNHHHPPHPTMDQLLDRLFYLVKNSGKMFGLAVIYGIMNILSFVSLRNIGAGTFTIFAQCKILTTAAFSAVILHRHYSLTKWRALLSLVLGVLLFSEHIWNTSNQSHMVAVNDENSSANNAMVAVGIIAVLIEVTLSGFASIYFEKVIKLDPLPLTIWERNFQLALVRFRSKRKKCIFFELSLTLVYVALLREVSQFM